jgi:3-oxoacyl-[acyl-carrier protein] reductase
MAAAAQETFGGIDYLVNNAAIYHGMRMEGLLTVDLDYYRKFMDVNMHSCLLATRACCEAMAKRGGGAIVNQSSTAAYMAGNYYGIAKLGLHGITVGLARELGPMNIRINAVAPGTTDTEATRTTPPKEVIEGLIAQAPLKRIGTTKDISNMCLFLLSDEASWITGKIFAVDGGQTLLPI